MKSFIPAMESLLSNFDMQRLKSVHEPVIVDIPPMDADHSLCVLPDGEIRSYGQEGRKHFSERGQRVYLASRDCGLSWKLYSESEYALGASVKSPWSDIFLATTNTSPRTWPAGAPDEQGSYAIFSSGGPSSTDLTWRKISDCKYGVIRLPMPLRNRKRWIAATQAHLDNHGDSSNVPVLLISDDDGHTWKEVFLDPAPRHQIEWPHEGHRWQNGSCEPTLTELSDGTLLLIARTSQDYYYRYYSYDGGDTWTKPEPSGFHGTLTMPTLYRMNDGRTLFLWCNTQPLPELKHENQWPPLADYEISGDEGEDVFTNRDANHAAISEDDGKTWTGFRELWLNTVRNDMDFRTKGGNEDTLDKSVHQLEAMELPFGKVLLAFGQNKICRKLAIFDPNWLYEKSRTEDFRHGAGGLSTHVYLKSNSGGFRGFSGHCSWNRTNGAVMVPDPDGNFEDVLLISRINDPRLFSEVQGAVWNFPAAHSGELTVRLRIEGEGVRLSLTDRWFNPVDVTISHYARFSFALDRETVLCGRWVDIKIVWDAKTNKAAMVAGDKELAAVDARAESEHGISYLHIQSMAKKVDTGGTLIKKLSMKSLD